MEFEVCFNVTVVNFDAQFLIRVSAVRIVLSCPFLLYMLIQINCKKHFESCNFELKISLKIISVLAYKRENTRLHPIYCMFPHSYIKFGLVLGWNIINIFFP